MRPGLFDLYLLRGLAAPFVAILLAVCAVMMLERALRQIHEIAATGADIAYFLPLIVRLVPYYLDLALPAAFMVALVLLVVSLDDRLELEAMLASGVSLGRIAAPLVGFGILLAGIGLVTGGWLEPLGRYSYRMMRAEAVNSGRVARLQPRAIYQPGNQLAVSFDRRAADGRIGGIFVWQQRDDGTETILTGGSGRLGFATERRVMGIAFDRGRYVELAAGRAGPTLIEFERLVFVEPLRLEESRWRRGMDQRELTLPELAAELRTGERGLSPRHVEADLLSRIARALILPLLPLFVLPLAFTTKSGRRGLGIVVCALLLATIHHGLNFARNLAYAGHDPQVTIFAAYGLCLALALGAFLTGRRLPSHSPVSSLLRPIAVRLARFRPADRALAAPSRVTLAAYLAWKLAKWTLLALFAIVALLQMVDLFERGEELVQRGLGVGGAARYTALRLPLMVQQALPMAMLAGAMATFVALARSEEMTAIRGAGVSQWRILATTLPIPLLLSAGSYALAEEVSPRSQAAFAAWWEETRPAADAPAGPPPPRWFRIGPEIVRAAAASRAGDRIDGLTIFRRDSTGRLGERVTAARANLEGTSWRLHDVTTTRIDASDVRIARAAMRDWPTALQARDVAIFFNAGRNRSSAAARRSLHSAAPLSEAEAMLATRIHRAAAEPLAPLVMLVLALPLAFVRPGAGRAWPAFAAAAGGGLLYLVGDGFFTVAGQVGYLPPGVGAWAAPVLATLAGLTWMLFSER